MQGYAGGVLILEKKKNAAASFCFVEIPEGKGASENFFSPGMMFRIVYILQFG
jgi:hypothetical protein